ncbi:MAG: N-acetyltransferase [Flavobacteriales bacterium]|nr:N-acetyltransferase [Flavobacteriales bacterium]
MDLEVFRINKEKQRFELEVNGIVAYLTYVEVDGVYQLPHTIVPKEIGGKGIGKKLVKQSLEYLLERNIVYLPICSFVIAFVANHKEYDI